MRLRRDKFPTSRDSVQSFPAVLRDHLLHARAAGSFSDRFEWQQSHRAVGFFHFGGTLPIICPSRQCGRRLSEHITDAAGKLSAAHTASSSWCISSAAPLGTGRDALTRPDAVKTGSVCSWGVGLTRSWGGSDIEVGHRQGRCGNSGRQGLSDVMCRAASDRQQDGTSSDDVINH